MKTMLAVLAAATLALPSAAGEWSEGTFVFLRPDETPIWRTATNSTMRLEWMFPKGATSADLTIEGLGYSQTISDIADEFCEVSLPEPAAPVEENVYTFTLSFDKGETKKAALGLVRGAGTGGVFIGTPCVVGARSWERIGTRAVLPVPYGTTRLLLNGEAVDTGLGGAFGWYAWGPLDGEAVAGGARLEVGEDAYEAIFRFPAGLVISFR